MNLPYLLLNVHRFPPRPAPLIGQPALPIIAPQCRPLPPRCFPFAHDRLPRHPVKDVTPLRRQALKIRRYVACGEVGGCLAGVGLYPLLFPARVQKLNCESLGGDQAKEEGGGLLFMCCSISSTRICCLQFGHSAVAALCLFACARGT